MPRGRGIRNIRPLLLVWVNRQYLRRRRCSRKDPTARRGVEPGGVLMGLLMNNVRRLPGRRSSSISMWVECSNCAHLGVDVVVAPASPRPPNLQRPARNAADQAATKDI